MYFLEKKKERDYKFNFLDKTGKMYQIIIQVLLRENVL